MNPHQANRHAAFIAVSASVSGSSGARKSVARVGRGAALMGSAGRAGSSTRRRIHSVSSAGAMPVKKTARQPKRGSTTATTSAAAA